MNLLADVDLFINITKKYITRISILRMQPAPHLLEGASLPRIREISALSPRIVRCAVCTAQVTM